MKFKRAIPLFFILVLTLSFINSAQTVQVVQEAPPEKKGIFDGMLSFLKSPIFWYIVIGLLILVIILVVIFFVIRWIVKFFKSRGNIYWALKNERNKLAKMHKRYPAKHFWKVKKNPPIKFVRKDNDGKICISDTIAYYRGDYTTHEGNVVISMNLVGHNRFFFFPITSLLIIPDKEKIEIIKKNDRGKEEKIVIDNLPRPKDIIQFNQNEILLFAESLSSVGLFFAPVLKSKDNRIVDLSMPVYHSLKDVVLGNYLYDQTDEFVKVAKKSIDINPNLRYEVKTKDASQSVEVPQNKE